MTPPLPPPYDLTAHNTLGLQARTRYVRHVTDAAALRLLAGALRRQGETEAAEAADLRSVRASAAANQRFS